jgi:predicted kinase
MIGKELILITGLPASGKSTLAERISEITGYRRFSSDAIRMEYFSSASYRQLKYSEPAKRMVFDILYLRAEMEVIHHRGVIMDGLHFHPQGWRKIEEIAGRVGGEVFFIQLIADYGTLAGRIQKRGEDIYDSEADIAVLDRYWGRLENGRLRYPTRDNDFRELGFHWFEVDASTWGVMDRNSVVPVWLHEVVKEER